MSDVIPAEIARIPMWTSFNMSKNYGFPEGFVTARISASLSTGKQQVLQVEGVPQQLLHVVRRTGTHHEQEQLQGVLSEVVTRADGTTISLFDLLDEAITAFAVEQQNNYDPTPAVPSAP